MQQKTTFIPKLQHENDEFGEEPLIFFTQVYFTKF